MRGLEIQQFLIDLLSTGNTQWPHIHAVPGGQAFRQSFMHPYNHAAHIGVSTCALQYALEPVHLLSIKLVLACVVQINEVNSTLYPVIVGMRLITRLVSLPLPPQSGSVKGVGKSLFELLPGFGRGKFMIADSQIERHRLKGIELVCDEIRPRVF